MKSLRSTRAPLVRFRAVIRHPVAPQTWDRILRTSGAVALAGIVASAAVPWVSEFAVLFSLTVLINGPYGPVMPAVQEPMLMVFARVHPAWLVAAVGTLGVTAVEIVNIRIYRSVLQAPSLTRLREAPVTQHVLRWFAAQPFATLVVCAFTPLPFWPARLATALSGYPLPRHLAANALGRFPRYWAYAAAGTLLPLTGGQLILATAGLGLLGVLAATQRSAPRARLRTSVPSGAGDQLTTHRAPS